MSSITAFINIEAFKKLVAMLRSGEYRQIYEQLANEDGFCVKGLMCEAYRLEFPQDLEWDKSNSRRYKFDGLSVTAPRKVAKYFGLIMVKYDGGRYSLINLNDAFKLTFYEVANIIENELREYHN